MPRRAFLLSIVFLTGSAFAQEFRASVSGQVTDSTGAIVPGAVVSVTSLERNTSFQGISNKSQSKHSCTFAASSVNSRSIRSKRRSGFARGCWPCSKKQTATQSWWMRAR